MSLDRRDFMKTLGLAGVTMAIGKTRSAPLDQSNHKEFYGILYDSTRCIGCQSCEFACAEEYNLPEPEDMPEVGKIRKTSESRRIVINAFDTSKGEFYSRLSCMHCSQPACDAACLTQAMHKTEVGPVIWRGDKCMGCRYCMVSCPFEIPKFEYHSANPKIEKCTMCYERIIDGKQPACVESCPAEALMFGTRRELIKEARKRIVENPDLYYDHIYGEQEAGGTGLLYLSTVPFEEIGLKTNLQDSSYPALTKGFISSIAPVDILLPAFLLGVHEATKARNKNMEEE